MENVSLTRLAHGAIEERINLEVAKILDNIADPNTKAALSSCGREEISLE